MHKAFISYHHDNDQHYKDKLVWIGEEYELFVDRSVDTGDIPDAYSDQQARQEIRDKYLRDSTVTIVLVGTDTYKRKHVDWEIHSSMYDGAVNKRSGIVAINLPTIPDGAITVARGQEEERLYPDIHGWVPMDSREKFEDRYPHMPERIIDNLVATDVRISVTSWARIVQDINLLASLIEMAYRDRKSCKYDLSKPMQRRNL